MLLPRPKDDPDAPPELELEEDSSLFSNSEDIEDRAPVGKAKPQSNRARSMSEDN